MPDADRAWPDAAACWDDDAALLAPHEARLRALVAALLDSDEQPCWQVRSPRMGAYGEESGVAQAEPDDRGEPHRHDHGRHLPDDGRQGARDRIARLVELAAEGQGGQGALPRVRAQRQAEGIRTLEEAVARLEEAVAGLVALPAQLVEADQLAQRQRAAIQEAAHVGLSLETVDWSLPSVPVGPLLPRLDAVRERVRRLMSDPR